MASDGTTAKIIRFGEQGAETAGKPKAGESDRMKRIFKRGFDGFFCFRLLVVGCLGGFKLRLKVSLLRRRYFDKLSMTIQFFRNIENYLLSLDSLLKVIRLNIDLILERRRLP